MTLFFPFALELMQDACVGGPRFAKSEKIGACDVRIQGMSVQYSANSMKATLKFDVYEVGGGSVYGTSHKAYGGFGRMSGMFW